MRENSWLSVSLFNSQFASFTNNGTQGSQLRSLFVTIITACTPASPEALWNEFRDVLCDDLERRMLREFPTKFPTPERGPSREEVHDYGLFLIESLMNKLDKTLADVPGMPMCQTNWSLFQGGTNRFIDEQRAYNAEEQR
jgi:hypothetical protein